MSERKTDLNEGWKWATYFLYLTMIAMVTALSLHIHVRGMAIKKIEKQVTNMQELRIETEDRVARIETLLNLEITAAEAREAQKRFDRALRLYE